MIGKLIFTGLKVPSVNFCYRKKGKDRSPHKHLSETIQHLTKDMNIPLIDHKKIFLKIHFERKSQRQFDLDNSLKSLIDCLEGILYTNDNQIYAILATKELNCPDDKVIVEYETLKDDD